MVVPVPRMHLFSESTCDSKGGRSRCREPPHAGPKTHVALLKFLGEQEHDQRGKNLTRTYRFLSAQRKFRWDRYQRLLAAHFVVMRSRGRGPRRIYSCAYHFL